MAGLAGQAITAGGFAAALIAFLVTATVLVLLLFASALGVALTRERFVDRLQEAAPAVKHWGGYVLVAVGAWFLVLSVFAERFAALFPV